MAFFLISSMVLGLLDQLQIFLQFLFDRITKAFNRSGTTRAVALDISKAFDREIPGQIFCLISFFLSNRRLLVVLHGKS